MEFETAMEITNEWSEREAFDERNNEFLLAIERDLADYGQCAADECRVCDGVCESWESECKDCVLREAFYCDLVDRLVEVRQPLRFYF